MKHCFKILHFGIKDREFNSIPFGRQLEYFRKIEDFKNSAKSTHFGQKYITFEKGLKDFLKLYQVTEYYCINRNNADWKDDSTEIWYKTN
jgi:hypothetical protein